MLRGPFQETLPLPVEERWEYTEGFITYYGYALPESAEDAAVWIIFKYTYDASNIRTKSEVKKNVTWNDRATLSWD